MANEVGIKIGADTKGFDSGVKDVKSGLKGMTDSASSFSKIAGGAVSSFLGNLGAAAVSKAFSTIKDGFTSAIAQVKEFTALASVQEDAVNSLNTSLALTGKFSLRASKDLQDFASSLQDTSKFGDELILKNAALIQSFGNLDSEGLKRATQAAADFASGTGKSFEQMSELIAKASTGQVEALKAFGIQVERTGDKTRDFENALSQIESKFGGSSKLALNTFSGAMTQTENIVGDFKESLGGVITSSPAVIGAIKGIGDIFKDLIGQVDGNKTAMQSLVTEGVNVFIEGIGLAGDGIKLFVSTKSLIQDFFAGLNVSLTEAGALGASINAALAEAASAAVGFFGGSTKAIDEFKAASEQAKGIFREITEETVAANDVRLAGEDELKSKIEEVTLSIQESIRKRVEAQKLEGASALEDNLLRISEETAMNQGAREAELLFKQQFNEEFRQEQLNYLGKATADLNIANLEKLEGEGKYNAAMLQLQKQRETAQKASFFAIVKFEQLSQRERISNLQATFGQIATLQSSGSRELFEIGKAAAIAQATISGIQAVQVALASAPPPLNFALAGLVGVAQLANLKNIAATKMTGAYDGAMVEGGSMFKDSQPYMLSKGEVVAPRRDFDDVVEGTARQRGFVKREEIINNNENGISINISGDVIGDDLFVNNLIEKIRDAVQFRNADLGVRA